MKIRFKPGKLGTKPDTPIHRWDIYHLQSTILQPVFKRLDLKPIFMEKLVFLPGRVTWLLPPESSPNTTLNQKNLLKDIKVALTMNMLATRHIKESRLTANTIWVLSMDRLL